MLSSSTQINIEFHLDTNAWRNLVSGHGNTTLDEFSQRLIQALSNKNSICAFSIPVAIELITHLQSEDEEFHECHEALKLMYLVARESKVFCPKILDILNWYFHKKEAVTEDQYNIILSTIRNIVTNNREIILSDYQYETKKFEEQLTFDKETVKRGFKEVLRSFNKGILKWDFLRKLNL